MAGPYEIFGSLYRRAQPNIAYGRVDCPTFNALQMSRKVTPNDFKSLPSKEEQIIIITNYPHAITIQSGGAQSVRRPDVVVITVKNAARAVSPPPPRRWECARPLWASCPEFKLEGTNICMKDVSKTSMRTQGIPWTSSEKLRPSRTM